jgi:uncharacterized protein (DUF1778 family)
LEIKKKRGLPPTQDGVRTRLPEVRCSIAEVAKIKRAAQKTGLSVSGWIRQALCLAAEIIESSESVNIDNMHNPVLILGQF